MLNEVIHGDALAVLRSLPTHSVDAIVTDPPAGIAFMGKDWDNFSGKKKRDGQALKETAEKEGKWMQGRGTLPYGFGGSTPTKQERDAFIDFIANIFSEALRVIKPGGHAFVWSLPRTSHWTALALEYGGWTVKDSVVHLFGSGMPKSLNVTQMATKTGLCCTCPKNDVYCPIKGVHHEKGTTEDTTDCKDLHNMQQGMEASNTISGVKKSNMQPRMQQDANEHNEKKQNAPYANVFELWSKFQTEKPYIAKESKVLQPIMQCPTQDKKSGIYGASEEDRGGWSEGVDRREHAKLSPENDRGEKSGMEWRSNLQAFPWELQGGEVCTMPSTISGNGVQERLGHGTPSSDGSTLREVSDTRGSRTPHRPQSKQQSYKQSTAISEQCGPQTCGTCGKPIIEDGFGTGLKPAHEIWWLARAPLAEKSIAENVLKWGTGAINIDASRIAGEAWHRSTPWIDDIRGNNYNAGLGKKLPCEPRSSHKQGRWPANLLLSHTLFCVPLGEKKVKGAGWKDSDNSRRFTAMFEGGWKDRQGDHYTDADGTETVEAWDCAPDCPVALLDMQSGHRKSGGRTHHKGDIEHRNVYSPIYERASDFSRDASEGGASRYFKTFHETPDVPFIYTSKASRSERNKGCEALPDGSIPMYGAGIGEGLHPEKPSIEKNTHPTVKPISLMRYLVTMITPPGGVVLDMFCGSGSTLVACVQEGFNFIGIDQDSDYCEIARARLAYATQNAYTCKDNMTI